MKFVKYSNIADRAEQAIRGSVFPGCVVGVVRTSGLPACLRTTRGRAQAGAREIVPSGHFTYEPHSPAVREDTIYDVASITKSIPTASLALMLIDRGELKLSDRLIDYVPEYNNSYRETVTIKHLLTYTVDGPQLSLLKDKTPDEILLSAYSHELAHKPGSVFAYSNTPALLLGIVLERIGGNTLDRLAQEYIFGPLGMTHTSFFPINNNDIAPTEIVAGKEVRGIVHDESARVFAKAGKAVGHAGLFSTAPGILAFLEALLRGKYPHIANGAQKGLGWELNQPFMGKYAGPHTFGKTGFTGTSCVCDMERGVAFVILSNCTYPARPADRSAVDAFRADIADIVFKS